MADAPEGRLVVVGTPIGNLGDLSARAVAALAAAAVIACEDTRRTGRLLAGVGVSPRRLMRVDDHTEEAVTDRLVALMASGAAVALVSDAGLPGLSDPGAALVAAAVEAGLVVEVVPGPFAGVVALVGSGLLDRSGRFCFEGFLPRRGPARRERLDVLAGERRTIVLYEAPHRVVDTLADLVGALGGERRVAVCRELTKLHEHTWRGTLADAVRHFGEVPPRGEFVIVLDAAAPPSPVDDEALRAALDTEIAAGASRRDAALAVAGRHGVAPNRVKRLLNG